VSSPRRMGLPDSTRMRHDTHFVDQLGRRGGDPLGRLIPIEDVDPNPWQPREDVGDLTELVASIREKGILEPILVRPYEGRFQIIAGERRFRAALEVGLDEVPCIIKEASDAETMELALIENLQRKDLSAFEEAEGMKVLAQTYGYTHEKMAEKLGKSRSSITEALSLTAMPNEVRDLCRLADIRSKSLLLQIVRQSDSRKMIELVERLQTEGTTRHDARRIAREGKARRVKGRPSHYVFRYQPREKSFLLTLRFRKAQVPREEVVSALQSIIESLMREEA
jgi:ParB family chromosome partitioning protein